MITSINHIAFIMDGNRRHATSLGQDAVLGHRAGLENLFTIADYCYGQGIKEISVYAFSTENWRRDPREVKALLSLMHEAITTKKQEFIDRNIKVRFIGDLSRFDESVQTEMQTLEQTTKHHTKTLYLCLSYGGRDEIVAGALAFAKSGNTSLTADKFETYLWSGDMSDPDMVIRTGGDKRLSGFLLWKASYSELYFTDTLWPAFTTDELEGLISQYTEQVRINKGK